MKTRTHTTAARTRHQSALSTLHATGNGDGLKMWRSLRKLETTAHRAAEQYCNGEIDSEGWEKISDSVKESARKLFGGKLPDQFFVNGDPRGYALKICGPEAGNPGGYIPEGMQTDWGGNGCLAAVIE